MFFRYGDVNLKEPRTIEVSRANVLDESGTDVLYTEWKITVEAIYAPTGSTSVTAGSAAPDKPPANAAVFINQTMPSSPTTTDQHLRWRLMQPRLLLSCGYHSALNPDPPAPLGDANLPLKQYLLHIPNGDVANGPIPLSCDIMPLGDGRTFLVKFCVLARVNECSIGKSLAELSPLLSLRWTTSLSFDDGYMQTRVFVGRATFRGDVLRAKGLTPDLFRMELIPPVPVNCKRELRSMTQSPDGLTWDFEVADVEQPITYLDVPHDKFGNRIPGALPRGMADIQVVNDRQYVHDPDIIGAARQIMSDALNSMWLRNAFKEGGSKPPRGGGKGGGAAGWKNKKG